MVCSTAQLAANRRNAAKSTGPTSETGKSRSRRNALKHGLTGEGVVVPDEDRRAIDERFEAFEADLKPRGPVAQYLARRAATLSVRVERCVRHESAEITRAMLDAGRDEADARADQVDGLVAWLAVDPAEAVRKLRRTPEGIDWLVGAWRDLSTDLNHAGRDRWNEARAERAERLVGRHPGAFGISKVAALCSAIASNGHLLGPGDLLDLSIADRKKAARAEFTAFIAAEIARLDREKADLDREALARADTAITRALFDASKESVLARKYEATAEREFYRALSRIEQLNAREEAEEPTDDVVATIPQEKQFDESGSFFPARPVETTRPTCVGQPAGDRSILPPERPRPARNHRLEAAPISSQSQKVE
jgi:hypothetical protein